MSDLDDMIDGFRPAPKPEEELRQLRENARGEAAARRMCIVLGICPEHPEVVLEGVACGKCDGGGS